jgi:serine/threonine protein kinase
VSPLSDATALSAEPTAPISSPPPPALDPGRQVGRFLVVEFVAEGGMGALYKAYDPQLDRAVALKMVRTGGSAAERFRERLLREARALARLSHPNVVTIYEAGVFAEDEMFVAMEFIEGVTLREWLRGETRSQRAILETFLAAGEGLAAAHRAGLIHRDFKPDNVLVGRDGRVRVVDFGLARASLVEGGEALSIPPPNEEGARAGSGGDLLESTDPLSTPLTELGAQPGTPRYMAAEQHLGQPATDKSDQFSFCVALYDALYRSHPFAPKRRDELIAAVTAGRVEPPPPGSSVPRWLRAAVVRGLSPNPEERFSSLDSLLAALRADPAAARRAWSIRAAVLVSGLGVIGGAVYAQNRPRLLCETAGSELEVAWGPNRRAAIAEAFERSGVPYAAAALGGVDRALDAYAKDWQTTSKRSCLARQERKADPETSDATSRCLSARLIELTALSDQLAKTDDKGVASAQAVALGLPSPGACATPATLGATAPPPRDPSTRARVDAVQKRRTEASTRADLGHLEEARTALAAILVDAEAIGHGPLVADVLFDLGRADGYALEYTRAESTLLRCIAVADASHQDATRAQAEVELVRLEYTEARYDEALRYADRAMGIAQRIGDDALTATVLMQRAWAKYFAGRPEESIEDAREGRTLAIRAENAQSPLVAELDSMIATAAGDLEHFEEAEREGREALAIVSALYVVQSERRARMAENLSLVLASEHKYDEALALQTEAVNVAIALWGDASANTAIKRQNLGSMLVEVNRPAEAIPVLEASLRAFDADPAQRDSQWIAYTLTGLGAAYLATGNATGARDLLERAVAIASAKGLDPDVAGESRYRLAVAIVATKGDLVRARALARDGIAELRKAPKLHSLTDEATAWLAAHGG